MSSDDGDEKTGAAFADFALDPLLLEALDALGFEQPTPIQTAAIPTLLEGRDVIGAARTGSGKTAAFGLPLLERLKDGERCPRALILAPTRELALQVTDALKSYAKLLRLRITTIYGGTPYSGQLRALASGVQVVVGTPGRLLDHLKRGTLDLSKVEVLVLDEADEMLRMGFIEDVETLIEATPSDRQVALFSATMPSAIRRIAQKHLNNPATIRVESGAMTTEHIDQHWVCVPNRHKVDALIRILSAEARGTALIFARTRRSCAEVADTLAKRGVSVDALHGDLSQAARERVLHRLRGGGLDLVVCTDVASRGLDVQHITHVLNYDLPDDTETYVHRIGRTGRAGREGVAISLATPGEKFRIRRMQRDLGIEITQQQLPSDAAITRRRKQVFRERLDEALAGDITAADSWMQEQIEAGASTEDLAKAAIHLLAESFRVELGHVVESERTQERKPAKVFRNDDVEVFFPIGRNAGVRIGDLVGAIANECGISGDIIGKVTLLDHKSFLGLPRDLADRLVREHPVLMVRGNEIPVSLARPRGGGGGGTGHGPPPKKRPFRGKYNKSWKGRGKKR
jgi:ATP-dependent RNA helicase DeaD